MTLVEHPCYLPLSDSWVRRPQNVGNRMNGLYLLTEGGKQYGVPIPGNSRGDIKRKLQGSGGIHRAAQVLLPNIGSGIVLLEQPSSFSHE